MCGGRNFSDEFSFYTNLRNIVAKIRSDTGCRAITIISGEARGADTMAKEFANTWDMPYIGYPADWNKYGKLAGHIRNKQMLEEGKPDLVVAFPGGRGTANMIEISKKAGVEVIEFREEDFASNTK